MKKILLILLASIFAISASGQGAFIGTASSNGRIQDVAWFDVTFADADGIPDADDDVVLTIDNSGGAVNLSSTADFASKTFEFDVLNSSNSFSFFVVLGTTFSVAGNLSLDNSPVTTIRVLSNSTLEMGGEFINTTGVLFSLTGGTVHYNSNTDQVIMPASYGVLELSGTGVKQIPTSGATAITASTFTPNTSTVDFNSVSIGQVLPAIGTYYDVILSSQNKELGSNFSVGNNLTINSSLQLETKSFDLAVGGNLVLNGDIINTSDEIVTLNGSAATVVSGSQTLNTRHLVINKDASGTAVTFNSSVEIESNGEVIVTQGALNANGNLKLLSTSSTASARLGALTTGNASIVGNMTVERYVPSNSTSGKFWWHIGSPLSGVSVSQLQDDISITGSFTGSNIIVGSSNAYSMRTYTETNPSTEMSDGWEDFPSTSNAETMSVGKGYRVYIRDNVSTTVSDSKLGVIGVAMTGDFDFSTTYTSSGTPASDGWNFIGNPYPSPIDWGSPSWTKTNIETVAYVWDAKQKNYRTVNSSSGIIPSFQSFWVQANATSPSLIVREECKVASSQAFSRTAPVENQLEISVRDKNTNDLYNTSITYLSIDPAADFSKDSGDINQLGRNTGLETWSDDLLLDIATKSEDDYLLRKNVIPASAEVKEIPLSITFNQGNEYGFEFHKTNFNEPTYFVLKDKFLGTERLLEEHTYVNFDVTTDLASKASDRFSLLISSKPLSLKESIEKSSFQVFPNPIVGDFVQVKGVVFSNEAQVSISDINGVLMSETTVLSNNGRVNDKINTSNLKNGLYLLTIKTSTDVYTQKIIIE